MKPFNRSNGSKNSHLKVSESLRSFSRAQPPAAQSQVPSPLRLSRRRLGTRKLRSYYILLASVAASPPPGFETLSMVDLLRYQADHLDFCYVSTTVYLDLVLLCICRCVSAAVYPPLCIRHCVSATVSTVLYIHYCICCCSSTTVYPLLCICRRVSAAVYICHCFCRCISTAVYPPLCICPCECVS